ncbi:MULTISPECIES: YunC family protein [Geomicrobium]|uniref:Uncharacterized protein YunC (DUF1805 family) n=1 Tax=Geomicrobium sediminis TaxID=1347788 RepID=A0ABS2P9D6_9BACL|nr:MULTISPECIES: DUF1805 domain-containing protein [Geomicrobium]EZH66039.1 hypothetical protein DH09_14550 [Bacillaceae bacterium JMAK1]MBM7632014.1 uncharacterized protein YunC (DUF1805 family) [Geomicrobium sediminis]GAK00376.1 hypothetical protein JCM19055_3461 [Geomicrobium sp. JCM 19055]GAK08529.1 hypothetical protein JCM19038_2313 [Geomicrobium sp. JCM 19038]
MLEMEPVEIDGQLFSAVSMKLPKTNFMAVTNSVGYIMCGALDVQLLNDKLKDRGIVAGRAVGVRTIDQLLDAPLESVTIAAEELGITVGMTGREALLKMK